MTQPVVMARQLIAHLSLSIEHTQVQVAKLRCL